MNDPYEHKRLELCAKESQIHIANCENCEKLIGMYKKQGDRADQCRVCEVGKQLREIGEEFLNYSRPRKRSKYESDRGYEPRPKRAAPMFLGLDRIPEYIKLRLKGLNVLSIAKEMNVSVYTLKNFVYKHNLTMKNIKG